MTKGPSGPLLFGLMVRHICRGTVGLPRDAPRLHSMSAGPMCHGVTCPSRAVECNGLALGYFNAIFAPFADMLESSVQHAGDGRAAVLFLGIQSVRH